MKIPCSLPGCRVEGLAPRDPDHLVIHARGRGRARRCPDCNRPSRSVHSRYRRRPADLPSLAAMTCVSLEVRRFYCRHPPCPRRTFAEPWPELVASHARRTRRLGEAQRRVGLACGGEGGARLLAHLRMPTSAATVLRLVKAAPLPAADPLRTIGVDDWAMRRGCRYGTIVVDLERRRVLDLLPDRSAATLAGWLRLRPEVAVVARDRSSEYARAASLGAPQALQVADRWHLLANMRQAVERWLHGAQARLRRLRPLPCSQDTPVPPRRERAFARSSTEQAAGGGSRALWQAVYDEVRRRRAAGEPLLAITRDMRLARGTVRKYAAAASFPARLPYGPGPSLLDPHVAYLTWRIGEGCENATALWRELRGRGYTGASRQVHRFVAERRTKPVRSGRKARAGAAGGAGTPLQAMGLRLPSPRQLAWLLVQPASALEGSSATIVAHVEQDSEARAVAALARRFTALVRGAGASRGTAAAGDPVADFNVWLAEAKGCGVPAITTFAAGLEGDGAAVRAALIQPWSSGQAEGQINRLKLIKRQSYGRAGLDLLRRRLVLAA